MQQARLGAYAQWKQRDDDHVEQKLHAQLGLGPERKPHVAPERPAHAAPGATGRGDPGGDDLGAHLSLRNGVVAGGGAGSWWVAMPAIPPPPICAAMAE